MIIGYIFITIARTFAPKTNFEENAFDSSQIHIRLNNMLCFNGDFVHFPGVSTFLYSRE